MSSIVPHKITLQAYTSKCDLKEAGCRFHRHHHYFEGQQVHGRGGGGLTLRKRTCRTAPLVPLGCVTCTEQVPCVCCGGGHVTGGALRDMSSGVITFGATLTGFTRVCKVLVHKSP